MPVKLIKLLEIQINEIYGKGEKVHINIGSLKSILKQYASKSMEKINRSNDNSHKNINVDT